MESEDSDDVLDEGDPGVATAIGVGIGEGACTATGGRIEEEEATDVDLVKIGSLPNDLRELFIPIPPSLPNDLRADEVAAFNDGWGPEMTVGTACVGIDPTITLGIESST